MGLRGIKLTFVNGSIVLKTVGKCAHRTPALGSATNVFASFNVKILYNNTIFAVEPQ
jgi:hypothetical protein